MFLCKLIEGLSGEAEQAECDAEKRGSKDWFHPKSDEAQEGSFNNSQRQNTTTPRLQRLAAGRQGLHFCTLFMICCDILIVHSARHSWREVRAAQRT